MKGWLTGTEIQVVVDEGYSLTVIDRRNIRVLQKKFGTVMSPDPFLVKGLAPLKRFCAMWKVVVDIIWIASARGALTNRFVPIDT